MSTRHAHLIREASTARLPPVGYIAETLRDRFLYRSTLLFVCPNSEAVAGAAVRAAGEAGAPLLFTATLNQVDRDGGYTGWTPTGLMAFLQAEVDRAGFDGPWFVGLDHGGPWLKDEHVLQGLSYDETMAAVKRSIEACLDAGYALLHIDPGRPLPGGEAETHGQATERTLELIEHAEHYRVRKEIAAVSYEVGSEEEEGGLKAFEAFLDTLRSELDRRGLLAAWPCFVVGPVGTSLNTSFFDAAEAQRLVEAARLFGSLVKGHNTDYVADPRAYSLNGMGGANVGPEFTADEFDALMELEAFARKAGRRTDLEGTLRRTLVASGRWKKWLGQEEQGRRFGALPHDRQRWLLQTGSRYVWTHPEVQEARLNLYHRLSEICEPAAYVGWRLQTAILKYYHAFNQIGFTDRLLGWAGADSSGK